MPQIGRLSTTFARSLATAAGKLKRTPLYDLHVELGGEMVPFAGFDMPVKYNEDIKESHMHTRKKASMFDVSHMGQLIFTGKDREKFLERVTVCDVLNQKRGQAKLSVLISEDATIIDDLMMTRWPDYVYMVVNAGCHANDVRHLREQIAISGMDVRMDDIGEKRALIALQGPSAASILQELVVEDVSSHAFMTQRRIMVNGAECWVTRSGYTGEDGFEISVPAVDATRLARAILSHPDAKPCGLGARDSLRLEAGLCLYGNDIDYSTTPIEAGLAWLISKRRKADGGFLGASIIQAELKNGVGRKRTGVVLEKGPVPRDRNPIFDGTNSVRIGTVTSGLFSPVLNKPIAMAYVDTPHAKAGLRVVIEGKGGRTQAGVVTKLPFVPSKYYKKLKP